MTGQLGEPPKPKLKAAKASRAGRRQAAMSPESNEGIPCPAAPWEGAAATKSATLSVFGWAGANRKGDPASSQIRMQFPPSRDLTQVDDAKNAAGTTRFRTQPYPVSEPVAWHHGIQRMLIMASDPFPGRHRIIKDSNSWNLRQ